MAVNRQKFTSKYVFCNNERKKYNRNYQTFETNASGISKELMKLHATQFNDLQLL